MSVIIYNFPSLGVIVVLATPPVFTSTATFPVFTHKMSNSGPQNVIEVGKRAGKTNVSTIIDVLQKD